MGSARGRGTRDSEAESGGTGGDQEAQGSLGSKAAGEPVGGWEVQGSHWGLGAAVGGEVGPRGAEGLP